MRKLAACAVLWLAACNGGGGKTLIHVTVDASGLSASDRASIAAMTVDVSGDSIPVHYVYPIAKQLADGRTSFPYYPGIADGLLDFRIAVLDGAGNQVSASERELEVIHGHETSAVIMLGASYDGGVPDAGPDADLCAAAVCGQHDGCCPAGCTAATDSDCAGCGNGRLDPGETCDPPGSCPVCDDQNGCTTDTQTGSAATCDVVCTHTAKTCSTAGKDQCCPAGCTAANDSDCAGCGDGMIDPAAGETCDPPSSCPSAASCTSTQCGVIKTFVGSAATCNAKCVTTTRPCSGASSDGCCPTGCNVSLATLDVDCAPSCGNGIVEAGETCDPPGSCPTAAGCVSDAATVRVFSGSAAACTAVCTATPRACGPADGTCPAGCGPTMDVDCPGCGNGRVEAGETCDPPGSCPTAATCTSDADNIRTLTGSAATCTAACTTTPRACANGDGFCPTACNANNDSDCTPVCGNGVVEAGETCDGNCPSCASTTACFQNTGSAANCDLRCNVDITTCSAGRDGCCPYQSGLTVFGSAPGGQCGNTTDPDCGARGWQTWQYLTTKVGPGVGGFTGPETPAYAGCLFYRVYGMPLTGGSSFMFTTCGPSGGNLGDTVINRLFDTNGNNITPAGFHSDNCTNPNAIPHLIGWTCDTDVGANAASCSSGDTGGVILPALPLCPSCSGTTTRVDVEVCPRTPGASFNTQFEVLFNGSASPNSG